MANTLDITGLTAFVGDLDCGPVNETPTAIVDLANQNMLAIFVINLGTVFVNLGTIP